MSGCIEFSQWILPGLCLSSPESFGDVSWKGILMSEDQSLSSEVEQVLDQVRKMIQRDGGDLQLVSVDEAEGSVKVRFKGACVGCPSAAITFQNAIERTLKQSLPAVQSVELVP